MLLNRVKRSIPPDLSIVPKSTPVPYFGNYSLARACTISINPSYREFTDAKGCILTRERLASRARLGCGDSEQLSAEDAQIVIQSCDAYFNQENNPYRGWFNKYEEYIQQFGYSYYDNSCVHLDLVQWATSPVWSGLTEDVRNKLLQTDIPFLKHLLEKQFEMIFLNGRTTVSQVVSCLNLELVESTITFRQRKATVYQGKLDEADVIGCSLYLQSQSVGGYANIRELAKLIIEH
jgi:hypothetical protein